MKNILSNKYLLIGILLLATILRLYQLDFQSLWLDEIYTVNISNPNNSISTVIDEVNLRDGFPYIYFITLKFLFSIFGYSAIVARALSVIGGILSIYLIFKLTNKLINHKAALIASFLMCISSYQIYISQDARPYTLYLAATIFVYYKMLFFLENSNLKNSIYYAIAAGILVNTNFFGFINLFSQFIFICFYFYQTKKIIDKNLIQKLLLIGTITILLFLPNWPKFLKLFEIGVFWVPRPTNESFELLLKEVFVNSEFLQFIYIPIFYFLLISIFNKKGTFVNNKEFFTFLFLIFWLFIFLIFLFVKSYKDTSLILARYFTSVIPVLFIVIAWGIEKIKSKIITFTILSFITIFTFINILVVNKYYTSPSKAQFREASNFVILNNKKGEPVYTSQKYWFDYYFKDHKTKLQEIELETMFLEMVKDSTKIKPFWYVDAFGKTFTVSDETQKFINSNFYIVNNYDGFQAWAKHFVLLKDVTREINISKFENLHQNNGDIIMQNVETFEYLNNVVKTSGWAYFDNQDSAETQIEILLKKEDKAIRLMTQKVIRPDVTTYFKCDFDASNSGFSSTIDVSDFETGKYQLVIYLLNKKTRKEGLYLTEKFIEK